MESDWRVGQFYTEEWFRSFYAIQPAEIEFNEYGGERLMRVTTREDRLYLRETGERGSGVWLLTRVERAPERLAGDARALGAREDDDAT